MEETRPLLAVTYGDRAPPLMQVVASAARVCRLLWLVDGASPAVEQSLPVLRRFGTVLDLAGLSPQAAAAAVAEHAPDGITTFRDADIGLVAELAARLGLPYLTPEVARRMRDKVAQRQALMEGGLPMPQWWALASSRDQDEILELAHTVAYPVVVKPRSGAGSWHTFAASDPVEFLARFAALAERSTAAEPMIVETYLPSARPAAGRDEFADYLSVESIVVSGRAGHVAVTGRFALAEPFRESGFFLPSELSGAETARVLDLATAALDALGVRHGSVHTEIKLTPEGPRIIEVNGRLGGGVPDMLAHANGVDLFALSMQAALGSDGVSATPFACERIGYRFFYQPPVAARRVVAINGLERFAELPGVVDVLVNRGPGSGVDTSEGSRSLIFSVVGTVDDHDAVRKMHRLMYEMVQVTYAYE